MLNALPASTLAKPLLFLCQALYNKKVNKVPVLRVKCDHQTKFFFLSGESNLYWACVNKDMESIATIIEQNCIQAARAIQITSVRSVYNRKTY